jgi:hypothetical protein
MEKYFDSIISSIDGKPIAGASVQVNVSGGGAATIYSDNGVTAQSNPITSEADGSFYFFAANGLYDIVITKAGFTFDADDTARLTLFDFADVGGINSQSAAYTTVLADKGKHILHPTSDNNARTFTINSNANVAYPIGTEIVFINQINTVTIAITADTMTLNPGGTTGSRTLAANGNARATKIATTSWIIDGFGLT